MQFSHALIALVAAGLANAQLPDVPSCSLDCFVSALTNDGCSSLMDFACHCQKPGLASTVAPCVEKACDVADQISVSKAVVSQCSAAGYPISVPPIETPASSSAGSSSASSSSSSPASATPSCSSPPTASSSSAGYSSTPAGSGSTPAGTSTPLPSKTSGGSTASTSPAFNAAGYIKGNMAGVAAVAAAAAYVL